MSRVKIVEIDIQCSRCGRRERITNAAMNESIRLIKDGWDSIGGALYCPDCKRESPDGDRFAGEKNTFFNIMHRFMGAQKGE